MTVELLVEDRMASQSEITNQRSDSGADFFWERRKLCCVCYETVGERKKVERKKIRPSENLLCVPSENPEQKLDLAVTICQEPSEKPEQETGAGCNHLPGDSRKLLISTSIRGTTSEQDQDLRADSSPCHSQEPSETPDDTNCQEKQKQELDLGMNNCQENQLEVKFPTPRTYLQILEPTGQDSYGMNYTGWHRKEQLDVSVTIVKDIEKRKDILQEVEVLELIRGHENVIGYYGAYYQRASVKKPHYEGLWVRKCLFRLQFMHQHANQQL
ncbi:uncharacterized protein LOC121399740 [Xenopus laevis]|uniref:Uncharacterized protein LOC121399740 n=1 Tax=Xenopus laevis TaxID=8355 RepID=A0A8J1M6B4_XENLA|nr:uncharacterized protein LOC121399740 [Xenopus laevis]